MMIHLELQLVSHWDWVSRFELHENSETPFHHSVSIGNLAILKPSGTNRNVGKGPDGMSPSLGNGVES